MTPPSDAGSTKVPDPFEFLKTLWSPVGLPMPGMVTPSVNVADIDKRISDLKSVENWLSLNLNVLRMTIQGLEMQRATLSMVQGGMAAAARVMQPPAPAAEERAAGGTSPADAWWSVLQQAQKAAEQAADQAARARGDSGNPEKK